MRAAPRPADIERFRSLLARRFGLHFEDSRLSQVAEALVARLEAVREPPALYLARLEAAEVLSEEIRALAGELTVPETYFFRNIDQFQACLELALPDRIRAQSPRRRLRILSAGCASGEEAYTLAILAWNLPALAGWDVSIRGVDLSVTMLERAKRARYSAWSLRETPAEVQARCFRVDGREYVLDDAIRALVDFEETNLADDCASLWQAEAFDVVFCRNVIMYFTPEAARSAIARLSRILAPEGYLFLGHAETLRGLTRDFHLRHTHRTFYYQRREASETACTAPTTLEPSQRRAFGPPLPAPSPDDSWVETIRRASERIQSLASTRGAVPAATAVSHASAESHASHVVRAIELLREERFSEAQATLSSLPADSGSDPDVLLLRAVLLSHGGDLAMAEVICRQLLARDEMNAGAHYLMALCCEHAGDRGGAAEHDQLAAYLDSAFAMPRLHLGLLARRAGDQSAARQELQQALALLEREDASRLLLFGGGFSREALIALAKAEFVSCGGTP